MKKTAIKNSMQSLSNGSLMRITPLCVIFRFILIIRFDVHN